MHSIYDFNDDRVIDELDVYCFYCMFEEDNAELFMDIYFEDVMCVIHRLN